MRPDFVFSDASVSPSFFFTTPAKKPRTERGCQSVIFEIAVLVRLGAAPLPPPSRSGPVHWCTKNGAGNSAVSRFRRRHRDALRKKQRRALGPSSAAARHCPP